MATPKMAWTDFLRDAVRPSGCVRCGAARWRRRQPLEDGVALRHGSRRRRARPRQSGAKKSPNEVSAIIASGHRSDGWSCAKPRRPPGTPARQRAGGGQGRSHPLQTRSCATIIRGSTILSSRWRRRRSRRHTSQRCPKQSCPRRRISPRRQPRRRAARPSPRHQPSAPRNGRGSRVLAPRPAVHKSRRGTRRRRAR